MNVVYYKMNEAAVLWYIVNQPLLGTHQLVCRPSTSR